VTAADNHVGCALVATGTITLGRRTPRADRMPTCRGAAFATAMRVITRVHHHTTHRGTDTAPTVRTCLANRTQAVLFVAHLTERGTIVYVHLAYFAGTETQLGIAAFTRQQLDGRTGGARNLRPLAGHHFDTVNRATLRHAARRQTIA